MHDVDPFAQPPIPLSLTLPHKGGGNAHSAHPHSRFAKFNAMKSIPISLAVICAAVAGGLALSFAQPAVAPPAAAPSVSTPAPPNAAPAPQPDKPGAKKVVTSEDICRAVEQSAAESDLPVEFFARVIWQESRFNALAVSHKGAQGIAQFMPSTAEYRGLGNPFDPIESLHFAAGYLRDLRNRYGNLGLAAASYNAGPGRVGEWLAGRKALPSETRNYVAIITGWTADEWKSANPPKTPDTTIPQGIPCARLANIILAHPAEARRIAAYLPRWGAQLAANWSESRAWATYRALQKRYAGLIGDREPLVIEGRSRGLAVRYIIRISDDSRGYVDNLCSKLRAAGGPCVVLKNGTRG